VVRALDDAATARRSNDALAESFDSHEVATSAFEEPDGRCPSPSISAIGDEAALRRADRGAAGPATSQAVAFETLAPRTGYAKASRAQAVDAGAFRGARVA